ncbi:hypothetical protein CALVIDRAFT_541598 [Calocera viscosa TUFC12733]|uniref:Uncharacterized protein n=1 Tax=Calocera viscosa (strain TUFC12733) TaxID=1330018 RepID=A0A167HJB8_CALVF|nr:hypothetical protein CALVIDRAFT_541598 [Calocera viscosa TUFC12733]
MFVEKWTRPYDVSWQLDAIKQSAPSDLIRAVVAFAADIAQQDLRTLKRRLLSLVGDGFVVEEVLSDGPDEVDADWFADRVQDGRIWQVAQRPLSIQQTP